MLTTLVTGPAFPVSVLQPTAAFPVSASQPVAAPSVLASQPATAPSVSVPVLPPLPVAAPLVSPAPSAVSSRAPSLSCSSAWSHTTVCMTFLNSLPYPISPGLPLPVPFPTPPLPWNPALFPSIPSVTSGPALPQPGFPAMPWPQMPPWELSYSDYPPPSLSLLSPPSSLPGILTPSPHLLHPLALKLLKC